MSDFEEVELLVVFTDLTLYTAQSARTDDAELARVMSQYYELAGEGVRSSGGKVVKFIGDAMLAVFPAKAADRAVPGLIDLKRDTDRFMEARGWSCRLMVKVHFGPVVAGLFGAGPDRRYDLLGKTVNIAARLESSGFALSAEAFRQLSPETRKLFKKHTPPVTYIRVEDPHHPRWAKRSPGASEI